MNKSKLSRWLENEYLKYESMTDVVRALIETMLKIKKVTYASVAARTKGKRSIEEKVQRKKYKDPAEVTDICGIRVITYFERDIAIVESIIRESVIIHEADSVDKSEELDYNTFGYKSVHLVCSISNDRSKLPEYSHCGESKFEIQIRSILQHAWAEIEHDRGYKLGGTIPTDIKRRLHATAGALEIIDREFNAIVASIEEVHLRTKVNMDNNADVEITTYSLKYFIDSLINCDETKMKIKQVKETNLNIIVSELNKFSISKVSTLSEMWKRNKNYFSNRTAATNYIGFYRDLMIMEDVDKYFSDCWNNDWSFWEMEGAEFAAQKYGMGKIRNIAKELGIEIDHEAPDDSDEEQS